MFANRNGTLVPVAEATLALNDLGVVWGAMIVERVRVVSGRPWWLPDHLARFRTSCQAGHVPLDASDAELSERIDGVLAANKLTEASVLLLATPGESAAFGPVIRDGPTLIVSATPAKPRPTSVRLRSVPRTIPESVLSATIKHRSRLHWWIAQHEASPDAALFTTPEGYVRETASANFLAVFHGELIGPPMGTRLDGIGLNALRAAATSLGIAYREREVTIAELAEAAECMIVGSGVGVVGVSAVDGREYPIGPVTRRLSASC